MLIDILLIIFTHIRTIRTVAQLLRGHVEKDEVLDDKDVDGELQRACCFTACITCSTCLLGCVDRVEYFIKNHQTIAMKCAALAMRAVVALLAVGIFVAVMVLLSEIASSLLTMQAFDGLGIIAIISSPVTVSLGNANVKAIENAKVINTQSITMAQNAHNTALRELARTTNEFNAAQARDLRVFNDEYCGQLRFVCRVAFVSFVSLRQAFSSCWIRRACAIRSFKRSRRSTSGRVRTLRLW